jgi:hypothetical protein
LPLATLASAAACAIRSSPAIAPEFRGTAGDLTAARTGRADVHNTTVDPVWPSIDVRRAESGHLTTVGAQIDVDCRVINLGLPRGRGQRRPCVRVARCERIGGSGNRDERPRWPPPDWPWERTRNLSVPRGRFSLADRGPGLSGRERKPAGWGLAHYVAGDVAHRSVEVLPSPGVVVGERDLEGGAGRRVMLTHFVARCHLSRHPSGREPIGR